MTAPIAVEEFATMTGYDVRTMRSARDVLVVELSVIRSVGGGRGRIASYELLLLNGAGAPPQLPLLGRAAPRRSRPTKPQAAAVPDLFEQAPTPAERSEGDHDVTHVGSFVLWCAGKYGSFFLRTVQNVGSFFLRTRDRAYAVGSFVRSVVTKPRIFFPKVAPLDVDSRARDVHTFKNVHTHAASAPAGAGPPQAGAPQRPPTAHPWHAWCGGRVHVPKELHAEFLAKIGRLSGESDVGREARLFAFYAAECSSIADDQPIVGNDYKFWRGAFSARFASVAPQQSRRADGVVSNSGNCPHVPKCTTIPSCNERLLAEAREERAKAASG
jgi:hypothetical protein